MYYPKTTTHGCLMPRRVLCEFEVNLRVNKQLLNLEDFIEKVHLDDLIV